MFEIAITEKEVAFVEALNVKTKVYDWRMSYTKLKHKFGKILWRSKH